jgi:hypothetical protein
VRRKEYLAHVVDALVIRCGQFLGQINVMKQERNVKQLKQATVLFVIDQVSA